MQNGADRAISEPFRSAEEAWFWTCSALQARANGARGGASLAKRACDPDDIVLYLDRLVRARKLHSSHTRILGRWGLQQTRPSSSSTHRREAMLWNDAMDQLSTILVQKKLVKKS